MLCCLKSNLPLKAMARLPRYVIPGQPQHIIQRGNNRQAIFAADADFQFFCDALIDAASKKDNDNNRV